MDKVEGQMQPDRPLVRFHSFCSTYADDILRALQDSVSNLPQVYFGHSKVKSVH